MEDDGLCLDLPVLDVDLVAGEDDGDVLTHPHQVPVPVGVRTFTETSLLPVPVGHVLVRHTRGHVKHDDRALALYNTTTIINQNKILRTRVV